MYEYIIIDEDNATAFRPLIREDAYPFVLDDGILALGIVEEFFPVAALVCRLDGEGSADILSLFVTEDHRRKGLATDLLSTAADILMQEADINRFSCEFTDTGEEEALTAFLKYLEFDIKEEAGGCFLTNFGQLRSSSVLKGEGKKCIEYKDMNTKQRYLLFDEEMDLQLYEGEGEIEGSMSCVVCNEESGALDGSSKSSTTLLRMLRHAMAAGSAYPDDQKLYIPVINDNSAKLAEKLLEGICERTEQAYTASLYLEDESE